MKSSLTVGAIYYSFREMIDPDDETKPQTGLGKQNIKKT